MNRELLWRKYPTDQRGTPFRLFWDLKPTADGKPQADIKPLHEWDGNLGDNMVNEAAGKKAVLLVRGELLQRYPNAVIWVWKAVEGELIRTPSDDEREAPIFQGRFSPDMSYAGFSRSIEDLRDDWFFVLAEQPTEPRFGLDVGKPNFKPTGAPANRRMATWAHTDVAEGQYLSLDKAGHLKDLKINGTLALNEGANSALMAVLFLQQPMQIAVKASTIIPQLT
jgi:hypothetical protein